MINRRLINIMLIILLGVALIFIATQAFSTTEQVYNPSASTLEVGEGEIDFLGLGILVLPQGQLFAFLVIFTLGSVAAIGGGLIFLFRFLNQGVNVAAEEDANPVDPLNYDSYGHLAGGAIVVLLSVLLLGMFFAFDIFTGGLSVRITPEVASEEGGLINNLFAIEFFLIAVLFGLVTGLFVHFLIYFRAREGEEDQDGVFIHGNTQLEILWTVAPVILVIILGVIAGVWHDDIMEPKDGEIPVEVVSRQWGWQFTYPADVIPEDIRPEGLESFSSPDLIMLVDQPYVMNMNSVDVLHSFWVPNLYVKRDIAPGVQTEVRVTPNLVGEYKLQCAELCGTAHSAMLADVLVFTEQDFREYIETQVLPALSNPVLAGASLYETQGCNGCHANGDVEANVGPTWVGLYGSERDGGIADEDYLRTSIINPNAYLVEGYNAGVMPQNYAELMSETEIIQLVQYIKSLSDVGCEELIAEFPDEDPTTLCNVPQ